MLMASEMLGIKCLEWFEAFMDEKIFSLCPPTPAGPGCILLDNYVLLHTTWTFQLTLK
jgi:hypothetical protein